MSDISVISSAVVPPAKGKRKKDPNKPTQPKAPAFSPEEVALLCEHAKMNKNILENKTSDAVMWKEKQDKWAAISRDFQKRGFVRTGEQLLNKWNALKKKARGEYAKERRALTKTGGGTVSESGMVSSISENVSQIVSSLSIHGGANLADSDADAFPRAVGQNVQNNRAPRLEDEDPYMEEDADRPESPPTQLFEYEISLNEDERAMFGFSSDSAGSAPTQSASTDTSDKQSPSGSNVQSENVPPVQDWSNYNVSMLRTPRSEPLRIRNQNVTNGKKVTPKYKNNKRIYATHERILLQKEELTELQKQYFTTLTQTAHEEERRKNEEHALKMQFLRAQEERAIALHEEKLAAARRCCNNCVN